ncbi:MAG: Phenylalanine-tRNA ligase beta subunit, partial [Microgenomates group bacterium GW2011_GWA2_47_8]
MNILIPDSWLREYLNTKATPKQIKEYLSLCGPSVERIHKEAVEVIYDVEITTNRPDAMSVVGVAREAAAILPRFGIAAKLLHDPYKIARKQRWQDSKIANKTLTIKTDANLNPRWTSIVFEGVTVKPSPNWLKKKLEATGIRSLNNIIDITNYLMRGLGQPAHAFDFDAISDKANHATMILRASKKGEKLTTLDGKNHTLPGDDIVIEDGKGRLIDLCGVMGAQNSAIRASTKTVILFLQTYDPMHIRRTMMNLAHRTEAGGLFAKGVELVTELSGGSIASRLYDIYPKPHKPYTVSLTRTKADAYIGKHLSDKEIMEILNTLGFQTKVTKEVITVSVPSFRRDVTIDVDIIEELARIYGYHNITSTLPDTAPPVVMPDPALGGEEEIKMRLRDWGYTETYTYSMISEDLMDIFGLDKAKVYKIANPLSNEWVYMRPTLWPSMLSSVKQNLNIKPDLTLFELSMTYIYRAGKLPDEKPVLLIAWTGDQFYNAKGVELVTELSGGSIASRLYDIYPKPHKPYTVS